ncbi:unnamed protein product [Trichogramma brassicae]|uniref:Uncharacterized protein n=1 Tax=Trichogramma brassicae TaxID=86971 RepID=A0A6H5IXW5_9HYME|nr:unnamed protein product [Trichogramma brassicae]
MAEMAIMAIMSIMTEMSIVAIMSIISKNSFFATGAAFRHRLQLYYEHRVRSGTDPSSAVKSELVDFFMHKIIDFLKQIASIYTHLFFPIYIVVNQGFICTTVTVSNKCFIYEAMVCNALLKRSIMKQYQQQQTTIRLNVILIFERPSYDKERSILLLTMLEKEREKGEEKHYDHIFLN